MKSPKGFELLGYSGSSGAHQPGATGRKGQGRAATCRRYIVRVRRLRDGAEAEESTGYGYHSRKQWDAKRNEAYKCALRRLGWKG